MSVGAWSFSGSEELWDVPNILVKRPPPSLEDRLALFPARMLEEAGKGNGKMASLPVIPRGNEGRSGGIGGYSLSGSVDVRRGQYV